MPGRSTGRRFVLLVVLAATCVGAIAFAAARHKTAPHPRPLKYACASTRFKAKGVLEYVARPSACRGRGRRLVRFTTGRPVYTCRKDHGHHRRNAGTRNILFHAAAVRHHGPAGLMRRVAHLSQCAPFSQPNETRIVLPRKKPQYFCVARRGHELRFVGGPRGCETTEFLVLLPKRPATPRAVGDRAAIRANRAARLPLTANDRGWPFVIDRFDTAGAEGRVSLAGRTVMYDPAGKFDALRAGQTATDSFRYRLRGRGWHSKYATVKVTVRGVDDAPVAAPDQATTGKNSPVTIAVLGNDQDVEHDALIPVWVYTKHTHGVVAVNPTGTITYAPAHAFDALAPGQSATDTFTYRASDGIKRSKPAKVTVTISGANSAAPVVSVPHGATAYTENGSAVPVAPGVVVTDPDSVTLASARVRLASGAQPTDVLAFTDQNGIGGRFDPATGVLTLTGNASKADYQAALRSVQFSNSGDDPSTSKTVEITANDGTMDSTPATQAIAVTALPDAPVVTTSAGSAAFTENGAAGVVDPDLTLTDVDSAMLQGATVTITTGFSAADADILGFVNQSGIAGSYDAGTGVLTLTGTAPKAAYEAALRSVTFLSAGDALPAIAGIEFKVNDGAVDSSPATKTVAITRTDDAPQVDLDGGAPGNDTTASFTEDGPSATVAPNAEVSDVDSATVASATITLTTRPDGAAESLAVATTGTLIATSGYDSATGVLTLSGPDTAANFQKVIRTITYYDSSDTPSTSNRVVSVKVNDGSLDSGTAQSTLSVTPHNDAPTATDRSGLAANEDTALPVTLSGTDPESDALSFDHDLTSAHGATITGSGATVTYTPAVDYCGPDSFGFTADDGHGATDAGTVSLTVACVNDASVVDLDGGTAGTGSTATFTEQVSHSGGAVTLAANGTLADVDDNNLASLTVTLTNHPDGASEHLTADLTGTTGIVADAYDVSTGVLLLHGAATRADYEKVLRTISYRNDVTTPSTADRSVTFVANDGHVDSASATATVHVVALNRPPVVDLDTTNAGSANSIATFTEDSAAVPIAPNADISDPDATGTYMESATITLTNRPDGALESLSTDASGTSGIAVDPYAPASGVLSLHGHGTVADYETLISRVKYDNASQNPDTTDRAITVVVNDGQDPSTARTATVHVSRHNDAITNAVPAAQTFTQSAGGSFSTAGGTRISVADPDAGSGVVKVTVSASHGSLSAAIPSGGSITGSGSHSIDLTGTVAAVNAALDGTTYTPDFNYAGSDTVTVTSDDQGNTGGAATTDTDTVAITVTSPANSAPVNTVPSTQTVNEDTTLTFNAANANQISTSDVDAGSNAVKVTLSALHGAITLSGTTGLAFSAGDGTADASMTFTGTLTNVNNALDGLLYRGSTDYSGADVLTVLVNDQGNTGTGGAKQDSDTIAITVASVNDPPVATDETLTSFTGSVGNTTLNVNDVNSHGGTADGRMPTPDPTDTAPVTDRPHKTVNLDILGNDTDVDNTSSQLTVVPGTFATKNATTNVADGGSVTIQADGDFNFEPPPGCPAADSYFDYTVSDNAVPTPGTDTGRVTVHSTGCVWYVNNNDAQGNSGTSEQPFDTLAQAQAASSAGQTIFVYDGDDTTTGYDTGISLKASQTLLSEAADLIIGSDTLHTADSANKATLTNTNADVVSLNNATTVKGMNIDPQGTGGGICGGTACGGNATAGSTLDDVTIADTGTKGTQAGLELNGSSGTFNISNLTISNGDGNPATTTDEGIKLNNAGTVIFNTIGKVSIATNSAAGLDAAAGGGTTSLGSASAFDDITVTNSGSGGVLLSGTTGSNTSFGDGSGNDLQLTTVSGATPAFSAQSAGSFSVPAVGQSDLNATGGPAIDVVGSAGSSMNFDSVSSTNSATDGINLRNLGSGTFSATGGTVTGATGVSFDLVGGTAPQNGAITYPGTFGNGSGTTAFNVTNRTGGVVTLSGNISDTNDAGGGVNVSSNTGGSTVFSGTSKQFNTGASDAITFANSDGHTLTFSGGGTDIDTTSGNGVNATTSGILGISGAGNTIDATALAAGNRGLNISDTDMPASDVTFQHITTSGGLNGVRLNNTGTVGNLNITGDNTTADTALAADNDTPDSGGTIQNASGNAIVLQTTNDFYADDLNIQNPATDGIGGPTSGQSDVTNFTLTDSTIDHAGQSDASTLDSAIGFNNQTGANENNIDGVVTIRRNTLTNAYGDGIGLVDYSGTISDLQISNNTITSATSAPIAGAGDDDSAGDGIRVAALGATTFAANVTKGLVSNNDVNNIPNGGGIDFLGGSQGTAVGVMGTPGSSTTQIQISGNDIDGASAANPMLTSFITANVVGRGRGNFLIQNNGTVGNQLTNAAGPGIQVGGAGGDPGVSGTDYEVHVLNNYLTPTSTAGASGIDLATDVDTTNAGILLSDFDVNAEIANDYVNDSSGPGIRVLHRDAGDSLNVKVNTNTVDSPLQSGTYGIEVDHGSAGSASYNPTICLQLSGNDADASGADGFGDTRSGIGVLKRGAVGTYDFGISGLSPSPATNAQTETYLGGVNVASLGAGSATWNGKEVAVPVGTNDFHSCVMPAF